MPRRTKLAAFGIALFAAISLLGCGVPEEEVEGSLTQDQADELNASLNTIQTDFADQNCDEAAAGATDLRQQIDDLPDDVGVDTKTRLRAGADQLISNIESDCTEPETNDTMPADPPEDTAPEDPVDPAPIPEEPDPVEPAPEEPTDPAPTEPDDSGSSGSDSGSGSSDSGSGGSGSDVEGAGSGGIAP